MKWLLFMLGGAGLLAGAGCASQQQQPYSYYPNGYTPPAVASTTYAQPQYYAQPAQPQYYAQPGVAVVGATAPPMAQPGAPVVAQTGAPAAQPVIYQAPPQMYQAAQPMYQVPQQACVNCAPCQCQQ